METPPVMTRTTCIVDTDFQDLRRKLEKGLNPTIRDKHGNDCHLYMKNDRMYEKETDVEVVSSKSFMKEFHSNEGEKTVNTPEGKLFFELMNGTITESTYRNLVDLLFAIRRSGMSDPEVENTFNQLRKLMDSI